MVVMMDAPLMAQALREARRKGGGVQQIDDLIATIAEHSHIPAGEARNWFIQYASGEIDERGEPVAAPASEWDE